MTQAEPESEEQESAQPDCADCAWYRTMIRRAAGDPRPRADLEALYGAHLRRTHGEPTTATRPLRSV
ncbi:hypothetical protein ABZ820_15655 [Streptomyces diacarni]|uniref:Uncharacterized protein n=1 Tax=Streptomyces tubbatahanensis TaxID=2923272 RepID=A0ABY3XX23_9ACTN|nr:hypothetical protein [Streptomyces tubbatahanensis]UNS99061.1 hypothetical protein MMF93_23325 [Streptomyces tubbatahanensis]